MSKTHVPLTRIEDNPYQSRIDTGDVESLAEQIFEHGLRQLPEARPMIEDEPVGSFSPHTTLEDDEWHLSEDSDAVAQLATGHRRVHAVQLLNDDDTLTEADLEDAGLQPGYVPIDLQRLTDEEMLDLLTVENAAREELTAVEQARLIREHEEAGRTQSEIGEVFGRSRSWVSHRRKILDFPERVRAHIHDGDLSVRQANALQPIFEADWEEVGLPEDNSFHPSSILEDALDGRSSEDLRRDVTQFESWMRQLTGETQEEIREQEYEQELEPDQQDDESLAQQRSSEKVDGRRSGNGVGESSTPTRNGRDGGGSRRSDPDSTGSEAGMDEAERSDEARTTGASVGGDGAPTPDREEMQEVIRVVASTLADEIDSDVLTRHLVLLGAPSRGAIETQIQETLRKHVSMEGLDGRMGAIEFLSGWLDELGYGVDLPETSPVGQVNPDKIDMLLWNDEQTWDSDTALMASIADLFVAHRVASERGEHWRTEAIAEEVNEREGTITEEDFPDRVWSRAQDEIDRRLEPKTA